MRSLPVILPALACMTLAQALPAQLRMLDFTGRPQRALNAELSSTSEGVEIANGGFVFVDPIDKVIRIAYLAGDSMQVLGRQGAGPGEYRKPEVARSDGKGGAFVPDLALGRAALISPRGIISGTAWTREATGGTNPYAVRGVDRRGRFVSYGRGTRSDGRPSDSLPINRWDPTTRQTEVLAWWPQVTVIVGPPTKLADGTTSQTLETPELAPRRTAWAALPDGSVAIIRPEPYRVDIVSAAGQVRRGPVVKYTPIQTTPAERDAMRRERGPIPDKFFPATFPPFDGVNGVFVSPGGEIWVNITRAWNDSIPKYDVFDAKGVRIARAHLAPRSAVLGLGLEGAYVAQLSPEDGISHLGWYRYPRK